MKKKAIIFALDPSIDSLTESLRFCVEKSVEPQILVPSYSFELQLPLEFSEVPILYPMDILQISDVDQSFQDSFQWMKDFSQLNVKGTKVADMKIANTESPKMWAWTHLLPAHLFLHFRFVKLIHKTLSQQHYDYYGLCGEHSAFPWKKIFLFQILSEKKIEPLIYNLEAQEESTHQWIEDISLSENLQSANFPEEKGYSFIPKRIRQSHRFQTSKRLIKSLTRKTRTLRKLQKLDRLSTIVNDPAQALKYALYGVNDLLFDIKIVSLGTWNRYKHRKPSFSQTTNKKTKKKGLGRSTPSRFKKKKNFLILLSPHKAPFYKRPDTQQWEVCDEYTEGVLESLIRKCNPKHHHIHIFYPTAVDFTPEKPSYHDRYPKLISEYTVREFLEPLSIWDDFAINHIAKSLEEVYLSDELKSLYSYEGTQLSLLGLKPLIRGFLNSEKIYFRNKRMWNAILDYIQPNAVIGGRLEAMPYIVESAKERSIKTLGIKLGIAEELIPSLLKFQPNGDIDLSGNCDINVLWGEKEVEFASKILPGVEKCLLAIGRPRIDTFVNDSTYTNQAECRKKLDYSQNDFVILFGATLTSRYGEFQVKKGGATFFGPQNYREVLQEFDQLCDQHSHLKILIKPWGGDDLAYIQKCIDEMRHKDKVQLSTNQETGFHNIQYIKAVDLIVSNVSCLFGESVACGTPVVNLAFDPIEYLYGSQRIESYSLISKKVSNKKEMTEIIDQLIHQPEKRQQLLEKARAQLPEIFGALDGKTADRITDVVFELITNKKQKPIESFVNQNSMNL